MGLTGLLARVATARPHVLVVEAPGGFRARIALERAAHTSGWCLTDTVADADVLAVVGVPGPELLAVVEHTWQQMSEPRARTLVRDEAEVAPALEAAPQALADPAAQARRGRERGAAGQDDLPLAEGAEDRDGLEMDELHLPLGPVLAHWPPGVVLRLTLHGDVVAGAEVERLDATADIPSEADPTSRAARLLDAAASVVELAGLPGEGARARRLRDRALDGALDAADLAALRQRWLRHRLLRWSLSGLVLIGRDRPSALHDLLLDILDRARDTAGEGDGASLGAGPTLEELPGLVTGLELAAVRLWMAALGPDLTTGSPSEVSRG